MTGLVSKATLFSVCGLMIAAAAMAGLPDAGNISFQAPWGGTSPPGHGLACLSLVGHNGTLTDDTRDFAVFVGDGTGTAVIGANVRIEFGACTRYTVAIQSQQHYAGITVNAATRTVSQTTNTSGLAIFRVLGGSCNNPPPQGDSPALCVHVFVDGGISGPIDKGPIRVTAYDQRDNNGVTPLDLNAFGVDFFSGTLHGRSVYDCGGTYNPLDLTAFSQVFFDSKSGGPGGAACAPCAWTPAWTCP